LATETMPVAAPAPAAPVVAAKPAIDEKKSEPLPLAPVAIFAPRPESHGIRNAALAACAVIAAFLIGYGWQNFHHTAVTTASQPFPEMPAASAPSAVAAVNTAASNKPALAPVSGLQPKSSAPNNETIRVAASAGETKLGKANVLPAATGAPSKQGAQPSEVSNASAGAPAPAPQNVKTVIVKRNDTLWELSQKYAAPGASADHFHQITSLNNLADPNHIEAGQRLLLPVEPKDGANASTSGGVPTEDKNDSSAGANPRE
jgi:LysM repeat protein